MNKFKLTLIASTLLCLSSSFAAKPDKEFNVSNLKEFRDALAYKGKRVIHFDVPEVARNNPFGFVIYAKDHEDFLIENDDITIDGGTAAVPVTLYGATLRIEGADNVRISNLHIRLGASDFTRKGLSKKEAHNVARGSLDIEKATNVLIENTSISWGTDETVTIKSSKNVTFKNSIISEPLNAPKDKYGEYIHYEEQPHGYCMLVVGSKQVLIENTLFSHCLCRSPSISPDGKYDNTVLVANNLIYNYGEQGSKFNDGNQAEDFTTQYTLNKNYYLPGVDTSDDPIQIDYPPKGSTVEIAVIDNKMLDKTIKATYTKKSNKGKIKEGDKYRLTYEDITLVDASMLEESLPALVGARQPSLDMVDQRILEQLHQHSGKMINREEETPEYPYLQQAIKDQ